MISCGVYRWVCWFLLVMIQIILRVSAQSTCPDATVIVNVTSRYECSKICSNYRETFISVDFKCTSAVFSPIVNVTSYFLCTMHIESDWIMWIKNTRGLSKNDGWEPYTMERYTSGFSLQNGDFFGGTENIAKVTSQCSECSLRFRMWDEDHHYGWVEYSPFSVADSLDKTLTLGPLVNGNVGDGMSNQRSTYFSASPYDWDGNGHVNIMANRGPWWHTSNAYSYFLNGRIDGMAIHWAAWRVGGTSRYIYRVEAYYKCKGA